MRLDEMILVSVDDHIVEPPDVFDEHLPAKWRDDAPKLVHLDDADIDVWRFGDEVLPNIGLNAVAGRPPEEYAMDPTRFDEMRPGCYDVHARVKDMDANGVLASLNFPSFPQFTGQLWARTAERDADLAKALLQAYNDWHIESWCGAYPDRFIPLSLPALWDPQLAADEVARVAAKGCHAVTFSENVSKLGFPSIHTDHWDPFFAACQDNEMVMCVHIGSSSDFAITSPDAPMDVLITNTPMNIVRAASDFIWSRVLKEFPNLKIALSEGGIGWVPYFKERIDYTYEHHRFWTGQDMRGRRPSDVFDEQFVTCFIDDPIGVKLYEEVGVDSITWECDYPHSDSTWPQSPEILWKQIGDLPDDVIDKISHENAMRHFHFDPYSIRPKERCTVAALREEAGDWDVSIQARGIKASGAASGDLLSFAKDLGR